MSQATYQRLQEWATWYYEHQRDGLRGDLTNRVRFLETTLEGAFDVIARLAEDVRELEGVPAHQRGPRVWLPTSFKVRGDIRTKVG
jgi:hypothetical protein